jgi:DNA-binding MarR family transcriptional regulator
MSTTKFCPTCGCVVVERENGRPRRFCSAACRQRAYRHRQLRRTPPDRVVAAEVSGASCAPTGRERPVPYLSEAELRAWCGILEVTSRTLPLLENELRRERGLTLGDFDVLYQIWRTPTQRVRMKDLAESVLVTPGGVTRIVNRLSNRGLVERVRVTGRQAISAALTAAGEEELGEAMREHFRGVRRMFVEHLSADDIAHLVATWNRLQAAGSKGKSCDAKSS